jgi:hypothetical protein
MKILSFTLALIWQVFLISSVSAQNPNPSLSFNQSEKLVFLDNEEGKKNTISFKSNFKPDGCENTSTLWEFTGIKGKDWKVVNGSLESDEVELEFKKIGVYSFTLNAAYTYSVQQKNGEQEEEEEEIGIEAENAITVTKNLDELTILHADASYIKLIKKAGIYLAKPEYTEDPTPNIYTAKGFYGVYLDESFEDIGLGEKREALDKAIECVSAAVELDFNGVYDLSIHRIWLNQFQKEWLETEILGNLEEEEGYYIPYPGTDKEIKMNRSEESLEGCEIYASISKNPIAIKLLEAALRYSAKDTKTANQIWKTEIPRLNKFKDEDFENMTEADLMALKYGAMLSAIKLTEISSTNTQACQILNGLKKAFEYDRGFNAFLKSRYNNCIEE